MTVEPKIMTYIKWEDAAYTDDYQTASEALEGPPYIVDSAGWLVGENQRIVIYGLDYLPDQSRYRHLAWVPKKMIVHRVDVKVHTKGKSKGKGRQRKS